MLIAIQHMQKRQQEIDIGTGSNEVMGCCQFRCLRQSRIQHNKLTTALLNRVQTLANTC